jgi:hypothetical protein
MIRVPKFFNPQQIPDADLEGLRTFATTRLMPVAGALGQWVREWCEAEAICRRQSPTERKRSHAVAVPKCAEWSGPELSRALWALHTITYSTLTPGIAEFFDRLLLAVIGDVEFRLEEL